MNADNADKTMNEEIETILQAALRGNEEQQRKLFVLMNDTWPCLGICVHLRPSAVEP